MTRQAKRRRKHEKQARELKRNETTENNRSRDMRPLRTGAYVESDSVQEMRTRICNQCDVRYEVTVMRVTAEFGKHHGGVQLRPLQSYHVEHLGVLGASSMGYHAIYCIECASAIESNLIEAGFVPQEEELRIGAVPT